MELAVEWRHTMHITACLDSWPFGCRETFRNGLWGQCFANREADKGCVSPKGSWWYMPRARKRIKVFQYMYALLGSKTTQSFPFVSNPAQYDVMLQSWCSYCFFCTGLHRFTYMYQLSYLLCNYFESRCVVLVPKFQMWLAIGWPWLTGLRLLMPSYKVRSNIVQRLRTVRRLQTDTPHWLNSWLPWRNITKAKRIWFICIHMWYHANMIQVL